MDGSGGPNFVGIVLGALVALATSFGLRIWQNERDRWTARVEAFIEEVDEAADLAVEFWLEVGTDGQATIDRKRENQILGCEMRLDGLLATFRDKLAEDDQAAIDVLLGELREAMTGGSFNTAGVKVDADRARQVRAAASDLHVRVRLAADESMKFKPLRRRFGQTES